MRKNLTRFDLKNLEWGDSEIKNYSPLNNLHNRIENTMSKTKRYIGKDARGYQNTTFQDPSIRKTDATPLERKRFKKLKSREIRYGDDPKSVANYIRW